MAGVDEALGALAKDYRLGIIPTPSSPGRASYVARESDLLRHFTPEGLIFSDEAGNSKPSPNVFSA